MKNYPPTPAKSWKEHSSASSPPGGWKDFVWLLWSAKSSTAAPSKASWLAASPLGTPNAPPLTAKRYPRWWGQPSTSLGPSSLPSRTSIPGGVRGRPYELSKTPATQVMDCSLCHLTAIATDASLEPTWPWTASTCMPKPQACKIVIPGSYL